MEDISIPETDNSPAVIFDFSNNKFSLTGMSYMENVSAYYDGMLESLFSHLEGVKYAEIEFDFALSYFNSSSARIVLRLFERLDLAAANGNSVLIRWNHDDDEDVAEEGETFAEDLEHAAFQLVPELG